MVWKTDSNGKLVQPLIGQFNINEKVTDILCKPSIVSQKEKFTLISWLFVILIINFCLSFDKFWRELHELAKAAIAGDEAALELFEYKSLSGNKAGKKGKIDTKSIFMGSAESLCFILSGDKGSVYYVNENAKLFKLYQMDQSVTKLLYSQEKSMLLSLTDSLMLGQYHLKSETEAKNLMTVTNDLT